MSNIRSPLNKLTKLGRGRLFFFRFDANGLPSTGGFDLGLCQSLNFTLKPTIEELHNMMGGVAKTYARAVSQLEAEVTIKGNEFSRETLALMFQGDANTFSQTGATISGETITPAAGLVLGAYYTLAKRNVTTLTDLKIGATTLVNNDVSPPGDYHVVDLNAGVVQILQSPATGAVVAGATVTADYITGTISLDEVSFGTQSFVEGTLLFLPKNAYGINQEMKLWYVSFAADAGPDLIGTKFAEWTAKAVVFDDYVTTAGAHGGSAAYPYGYILNQSAT